MIIHKFFVLPVLVFFLFTSKHSKAETLMILTSYEADVVAPVFAAFKEEQPDIEIRYLNKNTNAAIAEILAGNGRRFDLFWASSAEAFEVLEEADSLVDLGAGKYVDFAYSAVGWTWKSPFSGDPPLGWNDLLSPEYTDRIAMSHPMQSGSTHSLIETLLQHRGWLSGWAWLLELSGQLKTISARSFGVLEGVEQGRWDIGLSIDFLALKRANNNFVFRYGRPLLIIPARIAALEKGDAPDLAREFIDFITSEQGQRLLLRPDIRRIPVDSGVRMELAESLLPEVRSALRFSWSRYDPTLASQRYEGVNELFDIFIARDFLRRRDLWRRIRAMDPEHEETAGLLRRMLSHMPVSEEEASRLILDQDTIMGWAAQASEILDTIEASLDRIERAQ